MKQYSFIQEDLDKTKEYIENNPTVYLFHGTPPSNIESIKKHGLKLTNQRDWIHDQTREVTKGKVIFLTSLYALALNYTHSAMGLKFWEKGGVVILCKVNTSDIILKAGKYLIFNRYWDEYWYTKDIPVKDLIFEGDPEFKSTIIKCPYLNTKYMK